MLIEKNNEFYNELRRLTVEPIIDRHDIMRVMTHSRCLHCAFSDHQAYWSPAPQGVEHAGTPFTKTVAMPLEREILQQKLDTHMAERVKYQSSNHDKLIRFLRSLLDLDQTVMIEAFFEAWIVVECEKFQLIERANKMVYCEGFLEKGSKKIDI